MRLFLGRFYKGGLLRPSCTKKWNVNVECFIWVKAKNSLQTRSSLVKAQKKVHVIYISFTKISTGKTDIFKPL